MQMKKVKGQRFTGTFSLAAMTSAAFVLQKCVHCILFSASIFLEGRLMKEDTEKMTIYSH
jgi:hypothetical protein